ncbi:MAG: VOC family protein [Rubrobacter sp.]|nr:VOC family protein [Rubrobacter sp.]
MPVRQVPEGFHTVTPYVMIREAAGAIEFYKEAFGARETFRWADPDGRIRHAEIVIGDSPLMLTEESPESGMSGPQSLGSSPVHIFIYVEDGDALFDQAIAAGASELMSMEDQRDGDRRGGLTDPFGHVWWIATQIEDISREEIQRRYDDLTDQ